MRRNPFLATALALAAYSGAWGQFQSVDETPYASYSTPTGIDFEDSLAFEARPIVNYYFFDFIKDNIQNAKGHGASLSLTFDPQIRMFNSNSQPVRMPSYRVYFSGTFSHVLGDPARPKTILGWMLQHGHYSNGQEGCAFGSSDDQDSLCVEKYAGLDTLDLQNELNRRDGEYSTNFWRAKAKFLRFSYGADGTSERDALELTASATLYARKMLFLADVGGYTGKDSHIYPMKQFGVEAAWHRFCEGACIELNLGNNRRMKIGTDFKFSLETYWKGSEHDKVYPWLFAPSAILSFENGIGLMAKYEYGQDSYNVRFVDTISRGIFAFVWQVNTARQWQKPSEGMVAPKSPSLQPPPKLRNPEG